MPGNKNKLVESLRKGIAPNYESLPDQSKKDVDRRMDAIANAIDDYISSTKPSIFIPELVVSVVPQTGVGKTVAIEVKGEMT